MTSGRRLWNWQQTGKSFCCHILLTNSKITSISQFQVGTHELVPEAKSLFSFCKLPYFPEWLDCSQTPFFSRVGRGRSQHLETHDALKTGVVVKAVEGEVPPTLTFLFTRPLHSRWQLNERNDRTWRIRRTICDCEQCLSFSPRRFFRMLLQIFRYIKLLTFSYTCSLSLSACTVA